MSNWIWRMACEEDGLAECVLVGLPLLLDGCTREYKLPLYREYCSKGVHAHSYHAAKYQRSIPCLRCLASCQILEEKWMAGHSMITSWRLYLDNVAISVTIESIHERESDVILDPNKSEYKSINCILDWKNEVSSTRMSRIQQQLCWGHVTQHDAEHCRCRIETVFKAHYSIECFEFL